MRAFLKSMFRILSVKEIVQSELEVARRSLLAAQTAKEYANSHVSYNSERVLRLERHLALLQRSEATRCEQCLEDRTALN